MSGHRRAAIHLTILVAALLVLTFLMLVPVMSGGKVAPEPALRQTPRR